MAAIGTGIKLDTQLLNLRELSKQDIKPEAIQLLVSGEEIVDQFKTIRDQVVFTTKRILVINVQGLTGKKVSYFSYPYSKVQFFGVETAGLLDFDSELKLTFSNSSVLQLEFKARIDIKKICTLISNYVL